MTWYMEILAVQSPFDLGALDENKRAQVIFNIQVQKRPSDTFVDEIAQRLEDQGVGTKNTDIFATSKANIPSEGGPFLSISPTGGSPSLDLHNESWPLPPSYPRPTAQILVRAPDMEDAETMVNAAYAALAGLRNIDLLP